MSAHQLRKRANDGQCRECSAPRPAGRPVFCSDDCWTISKARREKERQARRLAACKRCGGEKPLGVRGGKYCEECRRIVGDTTAQLEHERGRRRSIEKNQANVAAGKRVSRRVAETPAGQKWCARCQQFRSLTSFTGGKKVAAYCQPCQRFYNSERRIKIQFGMSWDDYELLLACQDHRCAICRGKPRKYLFAVDHDHKTGEVRGLLCSRCNHRLLGSANDDPARLRAAADYLEAFAPREVFGEARFVPGYIADSPRGGEAESVVAGDAGSAQSERGAA